MLGNLNYAQNHHDTRIVYRNCTLRRRRSVRFQLWCIDCERHISQNQSNAYIQGLKINLGKRRSNTFDIKERRFAENN